MTTLVSSKGISYPELINAPLQELMVQASAIRDENYGSHITYSPKVFIPLTQLCRDRCGYCTFAQPLSRYPNLYMSKEEVLEIVLQGQSYGCREALITLGEKPELRYEEAKKWLTDHGYNSTVSYVAAIAQYILDNSELLPHTNAGAIDQSDLALLKTVSVSQGMMLESIRQDLNCHQNAPDKTPARRLATLEAAGQLQIPFTTGLLVGIGDDRADRIRALEAINQLHRRYGHIQEVIIQNFLPKPGISMHKSQACDTDEHLWTIAVARILLDPQIHLQAPPNLSDDIPALLEAGIDDFGGISPVTIDHVNPERPWPVVEDMAKICLAQNKILTSRLAVYKEYLQNAKPWIDERLLPKINEVSDAEGLARPLESWFSGSGQAPLRLRAKTANSIFPSGCKDTSAIKTEVSNVVDAISDGLVPEEEELLTLFLARGQEVDMVCELADSLRKKAVGNRVSYVANRNINYTNICTFKCRFCAFSKGPLSLNLRGDPYLLDMDEILSRCFEATEKGATEVCLQGGIHPQFDGNYYINLIETIHREIPNLHIHAFSALEIHEGARRLGIPLEQYLTELKNAGLKSLPGTAAEILDDEIRKTLCPDKISTEQWLQVHETAHKVGLRSNVTIMFGSIEHPRHWVKHLLLTRNLQRKTGGFTEFVPLPFVHMASPIYLTNRARKGPTFRETLLMHAVGRICYYGFIDNIQASWTKIGPAGIAQLLNAGCNDLGGTLMDENISRAAGADHGQMMTESDFRKIVNKLDRQLVRRNTFYDTVAV